MHATPRTTGETTKTQTTHDDWRRERRAMIAIALLFDRSYGRS